MKDDTQKLAMFYDQVGRELFRKLAQGDLADASEADSNSEFGAGGKPKLTALVQKLMAKKGKK